MKIRTIIAACAAAAIVVPAFAQDAPAPVPTPAVAETAASASVGDTARQLTGQLVMSLFDRMLKGKAKPQAQAANQPVAETDVAAEQPQPSEEPQEAPQQAPQQVRQ